MKNDPKLVDSTEAASRLGVSTWVLKGVKIAAEITNDSPYVGRYTTVPEVMRWFRRHPEFVASHYLRHRKKAK